MTPEQRGALAAEVGLCLFGLQQRFHAETPLRRERLRALAIARIARQRGTTRGDMSRLFNAFGGDGTRAPRKRSRGRPVKGTTAVVRAANLACLLSWALTRARAAVSARKLHGFADTVACAVCLCNRSNLTNYRNGKIANKGYPVTHRLFVAVDDLQQIVSGAEAILSNLGKQQRKVCDTVQLGAVAQHLLDLARILARRVARRGYGTLVIRDALRPSNTARTAI